MAALTMMRLEEIQDRPFRVLRMSLSGVLKLGRVVYLRTKDGRILHHGFIDKTQEGPGVAVDDTSFGPPDPGALVVPVDEPV